jgi:riboflavin kinase / FMN adenylyltransferase
MPAATKSCKAATVCDDGERVSSSAVRSALAAGNLALAQRLLGRRTRSAPRAARRQARPRASAFPTLNLRIARTKMRRGAARHVRGEGAWPRDHAGNGVASIGLRPTVDDSGRWLLEVHVFDFSQQVYGTWCAWSSSTSCATRSKYDILAALTHAIGRDADHARALLARLDKAPAELGSGDNLTCGRLTPVDGIRIRAFFIDRP